MPPLPWAGVHTGTPSHQELEFVSDSIVVHIKIRIDSKFLDIWSGLVDRELEFCATACALLFFHHQTADNSEREETDCQTNTAASVILDYTTNLADRT